MFALYLFKYNLYKVFQCKLGRFKSNSIGVDRELRAAFFEDSSLFYKDGDGCIGWKSVQIMDYWPQQGEFFWQNEIGLREFLIGLEMVRLTDQARLFLTQVQ